MSKALELLEKKKDGDPVKKPSYYTWHSLFECRELTSSLPFNEGNAIKYLYRCGIKGTPADFYIDKAKAVQYIEMMVDTPLDMQRMMSDTLDEFFCKIYSRLSEEDKRWTQNSNARIIAVISKIFPDPAIGRAFASVLDCFRQTNLHDRTTLKARVEELLR